MPREEHVSLWHPWQDKPGQRHTPVLYSGIKSDDIDETVRTIAGEQYYGLVTDILNGIEVNPLLLRDKRTQAYLSRTGNVSALRIKSKRKSGFLIPSSSWGSLNPGQDTIRRMNHVYQTFGYEAISPSSLSEKVLRATLPDRTYISRPSAMLRKSLLDNSTGGRIDKKKISRFLPVAFEYDINKAYLYIAGQGVPNPFITPVRWYGDEEWWKDKAVSWLQVRMQCHRDKGIQPIQLRDEYGEMREPVDGEEFTTWLWSGEVEDCIGAGYTLQEAIQGWSWDTTSTFMKQWSDVLWEKYEKEEDEEVRGVMKTMMVGLPGRFLRRPETLTLVHCSEAKGTDLPLAMELDGIHSPMSEWCMRIEENIDDAQLTPIGSYIIAECRRKLYHDCKSEEHMGNAVVRIYIDSITTVRPSSTLKIGTGRGEYKVKKYHKVKIKHNRFIGYNEQNKLVVKAPGVSLVDKRARRRVVQEMESVQWLQSQLEKPPP